MAHLAGGLETVFEHLGRFRVAQIPLALQHLLLLENLGQRDCETILGNCSIHSVKRANRSIGLQLVVLNRLFLSLFLPVVLAYGSRSLFHGAVLLLLELRLPLPLLVEVHDHIGLALGFSELLLSVSTVPGLAVMRLHVYLNVLRTHDL